MKVLSRMFVLSLAALPALVACSSDKAAKKDDAAPVSGAMGPAAQAWAKAEQPAEFVEFFRGTFKDLGVVVQESGERFTVTHTGTGFAFRDGIDEAKVDFVVPIKQENVDGMVTIAADGKLDDADAFAIMSVMFTPLTREIMKHPVTQDDTLRQLSGVEDSIHVILLDPQGNEGASHTMTYADKKWNVSEGLSGTPKRVFRINAQQALEYQRRAHAAIEANSPMGWNAFSTWYKEWRETCSTVAAG
jgi:hypothetical protein